MNSPHHQTPFWKRAHKDWRVWTGAILMLAAMAVYVLSDDFSIVPAEDAPTADEYPAE